MKWKIAAVNGFDMGPWLWAVPFVLLWVWVVMTIEAMKEIRELIREGWT